MAKDIRVDRLISNLGLLSRNDCRTAAKRGRITVNGKIITSSDVKIDRKTDAVTLDGALLDCREFVYYMLNKPAGVITAADDPNCRTVMDLIEDKRTDLSPVGRLDKDTTGFLLITNDGQLGHRLLSPKHHVPKTYLAEIAQPLTDQDIALLERGVDIGDETPTLPAKVEIPDPEAPASVLLTITEGRYHQVKRMFEAVGKPVMSLHRQSFGALALDPSLAPGEYRELTEEEMKMIAGDQWSPLRTE